MSIEDFDLEKFDADWEARMEAEENEETETESEKDVETEEVEEVSEEDVEETAETEEVETPNLSDEEKRNAAFAQLRRERDEAAKYAEFIKKIAEENGTTPEELQKNYEEARLQREAEEKGVPVEIMQRLQQQENELNTLKNQTFSERFNNQVTQTAEKYKASKEDIEATFKYAAENGLIETLQSGTLQFEAVHKIAHMDSLIEKQVQNALQDTLTKKKKRQQEAPLPHTTSTPSSESLEDMAIRDAKAIMEGGGF